MVASKHIKPLFVVWSKFNNSTCMMSSLPYNLEIGVSSCLCPWREANKVQERNQSQIAVVQKIYKQYILSYTYSEIVMFSYYYCFCLSLCSFFPSFYCLFFSFYISVCGKIVYSGVKLLDLVFLPPAGDLDLLPLDTREYLLKEK